MAWPSHDDCDDPSAFRSHTEIWGEVVKAGIDSGKSKGVKAETDKDCCRACVVSPFCNVWVWCADTQKVSHSPDESLSLW